MKLILNIYDHSVIMHVKFHQGVIRYRSHCPLIAYILMIFYIVSNNLVSNGWNFMKFLLSIYMTNVWLCTLNYVRISKVPEELFPFECLN